MSHPTTVACAYARHVELPSSIIEAVAPYASVAVTRVHCRSDQASIGAAATAHSSRMRYCPPAVPGFRCGSRSGMLCSWMSQRPGAVPQRGVWEGVVQRYSTFAFTILDCVRVIRCQTYLATRLNEPDTALAAHAALRPTCVREVVATKASSHKQSNPVAW